jgi:ABC-type glycerol-3-phosphate transport system substrate-binding protein
MVAKAPRRRAARMQAKLVVGAVTIVMLLATLAGLKPQAWAAGSQTTITFVNTAGAVAYVKPLIQKAIADFEADNPDIKIQAIDVPFVNIETQLATMAAAGNLPDVTQVTNNEIATLQSRNQLAPLDSYDPQLLGTLAPASIRVGTVQGKLYGLPWDFGPSELFYNRDLMKQAGLDPASPPRTLDQFMTDLLQAKSRIPNVVAFGLDTTIRTFGLDQNWAPMLAFWCESEQERDPGSEYASDGRISDMGEDADGQEARASGQENGRTPSDCGSEQSALCLRRAVLQGFRSGD